MSELAQSALSVGIREWLVDTPLESNAEGYVKDLTGHGYALRTMQFYVGAVAHFSHWLAGLHIGLTDIDEKVIHRFLDRHLPHCRCCQHCRRGRTGNSAALEHLLKFLRASGQVAVPFKAEGFIDRELKDFEHYLLRVRGVGTTTRDVRLNHIRSFLLGQFNTGPVLVSSLDGKSIERFVTRYTEGWTVESRSTVCVSLRSYLRFKAIQEEPTDRLAAAIPKVAARRLAHLPQTVSAVEIERLFAAFDRRSAVGRRNFAITHCLVDLGLRAGEVPRLTLEDIDGRQGTICVHGKGHRADLLPLRDGPRSSHRAVFTPRSTHNPIQPGAVHAAFCPSGCTDHRWHRAQDDSRYGPALRHPRVDPRSAPAATHGGAAPPAKRRHAQNRGGFPAS
jgi:integrase/recombinase XerD